MSLSSVLQCVAVCCIVLQCVAVCCSVLRCVAVCCSVLQCVAVLPLISGPLGLFPQATRHLQCCVVLQCVAVCCGVLQCVAVTPLKSRPLGLFPRTTRHLQSFWKRGFKYLLILLVLRIHKSDVKIVSLCYFQNKKSGYKLMVRLISLHHVLHECYTVGGEDA